ncbi:hypothetical protein C8F01DRAFT_698391 [Mycena amicta]|nr:hypothetical protein C8F01DRAFT_698391 [Mycena amicta]
MRSRLRPRSSCTICLRWMFRRYRRFLSVSRTSILRMTRACLLSAISASPLELGDSRDRSSYHSILDEGRGSRVVDGGPVVREHGSSYFDVFELCLWIRRPSPSERTSAPAEPIPAVVDDEHEQQHPQPDEGGRYNDYDAQWWSCLSPLDWIGL